MINSTTSRTDYFDYYIYDSGKRAKVHLVTDKDVSIVVTYRHSLFDNGYVIDSIRKAKRYDRISSTT